MLRSVNPSSPVITYGNVQEAVADGIRDLILKGQLKPGDRLRQDELANTFGVSTMPVREALRQLQAEGLVNVSVKPACVFDDVGSCDRWTLISKLGCG